jgi:hypothetical protein
LQSTNNLTIVWNKNAIRIMTATFSKATCLLVLPLLFLTGCASPLGNFRTKKDPSYHDKLGKVLIVSLNEDMASRLGRDFSNRLLTRLTGSLAQKDVASEIVHVNKEDLDQTAPVKSAAARFHPSQLLYIAVTRVLSRNEARPATVYGLPQFASEVSIVIAFSVVDMQSGKTVWRGEVQFYTIPYPEDVADQLVKQLETEKLF